MMTSVQLGDFDVSFFMNKEEENAFKIQNALGTVAWIYVDIIFLKLDDQEKYGLYMRMPAGLSMISKSNNAKECLNYKVGKNNWKISSLIIK